MIIIIAITWHKLRWQVYVHVVVAIHHTIDRAFPIFHVRHFKTCMRILSPGYMVILMKTINYT